MTKVVEIVKNVWTNRAGFAAALMAALLAWTPIATILARKIQRPDPSAKWWKRALYDLFIDTPSWAAALGRSGLFGGIFNVPGLPSRQPDDNPTPAESKAARSAEGGFIVIPILTVIVGAGLAFALAVVLSGCGPAGRLYGINYGACMAGKGLHVVDSIPGQVDSILSSGSPQATAVAQLEGLAGTAAIDAVVCAVQAWIAQPPAHARTTAARSSGEAAGRAWLATHGVFQVGG